MKNVISLGPILRLLAVAAWAHGLLLAANPIITAVYTADPAALVHGDTVYLYTGHDLAEEGKEGYVMKSWLCFSSTDMVTWTPRGSPLALTDFKWAKKDAWAGHVIARAGKFYWYAPVYHATIPGFAIGVAVADSPTGPFQDARGSALITNDMTTQVPIEWDDIDPAAFIDDDGQAYLFFGNQRCKYVKLKANMTETDGPIHVVEGLEKFTEAPWVHKRGDLYYLSYACDFPEKIAYATSKSITGPWAYRGVINDYPPNCNTNHQSIIEFKGRSYFIYHNGAAPHGGSFRRSVCVEVLDYNADGTIRPIVQTTAGIGSVEP